MSVLVYANTANNEVHKSAFEAVSYGSELAQKLGTDTTAILIGSAGNPESLGTYGANKVLTVAAESFDPNAFASVIQQAAAQEGADVIIFAHDFAGKAIAPLVAAKLDAGLVSGAVDHPNLTDGFVVKKAVFSGKAFAHVKINADKKVISLMPNSVEKKEQATDAAVEAFAADMGDSRISVKEVKMESTEMPLTEADRVVSAGRGLKGPEHWGIIEELAKEMQAATACSRPVADMDWRPHHEHVGQTGVAIRPNLYIAIGISGAIQHLAGVNQSKTIVVINNDPEAPFFKSADYGIVGDAFEVVPKLIDAAKEFNASNN